jgi:shikimate kinase
VVLVGLPGAGTSAVGRRLAERLGLPLRDSDRDVEAALGASAADIFLDGGEQAFRQAERTAVLEAVRTVDDPGAIVVVGGAAVSDADVVSALAGSGAPVVFLDVQLGDAIRRLGLHAATPAGLGSPRATWQRLAQERRRDCAAVATVRVETDGLTPDQVTDQVLERLGRSSPVTVARHEEER